MRLRSRSKSTNVHDLRVILVFLISGCAGAFGGIGPGMTNEARTNTGCVPDAPGSSMGTCSTTNYNSGDLEFGTQLGVRTGAVSGSAGELGSGTGLGIDAHADFVVAAEKWGAGLSFAYSNDQIFSDPKLFYWGIPIVAYGQWGLTRRIFVHGGVGRVVHGSLRVGEDESAAASAWRAVAGISFVFARNPKRDLAFRLEVRSQRSSDAMLAGMTTHWSSNALMGEIIWASF